LRTDLIFITNAASTTPSWLVPAVAGAFTLLGVLIAAGFSTLRDRSNNKREDEQRWHDLIREEASKLMVVAEEALEAMAAQRPASPSPSETTAKKREQVARVRTANAHYMSLRTIASERVADAAGAVYANLLSVGVNNTSQFTALAAHRTKANNLIDVIREEIGIKESKGKKSKKKDNPKPMATGA
jgi:hypothetical protein